MVSNSTAALARGLGLHRIASGIESQPQALELERTKWLHLLLEKEADFRRNKRFKRQAKFAKLSHNVDYDDFDLFALRGLDHDLFRALAGCDWIRAKENLLVAGPEGVGKTWLACAIGYKALLKGFSVRYYRASRLLADIGLARAEGRQDRILGTIARIDVVIIDDWGYEVLNAEERCSLLEILMDRHESRSTVVVSRLPVDGWCSGIENRAVAAGAFDRLVENAYRIELGGESLRTNFNPVLVSD
jgi:DNA replication protein DnaC